LKIWEKFCKTRFWSGVQPTNPIVQIVLALVSLIFFSYSFLRGNLILIIFLSLVFKKEFLMNTQNFYVEGHPLKSRKREFDFSGKKSKN